MTYSSKQLSSLPGEHRVAGQPPTCLSQPHQSKSWSPLAYRLPAAFLILILLCMPFDRPDRLTAHLLPALTPLNLEAITTGSAPKCLPQHTIHPQHNQNLDNAYLHLHSHDFANSSLAHWQALIQVDTQSFDQQGPVKDNPEQYQHFKHFDVALRKHFPLVFQRLHLEMVNTYGYLFTWHGLDPNLKPACFVCLSLVPAAQQSKP